MLNEGEGGDHGAPNNDPTSPSKLSRRSRDLTPVNAATTSPSGGGGVMAAGGSAGAAALPRKRYAADSTTATRPTMTASTECSMGQRYRLGW